MSQLPACPPGGPGRNHGFMKNKPAAIAEAIRHAMLKVAKSRRIVEAEEKLAAAARARFKSAKKTWKLARKTAKRSAKKLRQVEKQLAALEKKLKRSEPKTQKSPGAKTPPPRTAPPRRPNRPRPKLAPLPTVTATSSAVLPAPSAPSEN